MALRRNLNIINEEEAEAGHENEEGDIRRNESKGEGGEDLLDPEFHSIDEFVSKELEVRRIH
jgi:hypothetical protein